MFETPILFAIFNRPDTTQKVFDQIKKIKPKQLFVSADAPRPNRPDDIESCAQTRKIVKQIDWPCEVKTLFQEKNVGCGVALSSAINWFFDHVDDGIILEDDCLPNNSFFYFCKKLLERYKDDHRVFHIGGTSYRDLMKSPIESDYYFTQIPQVWGWATWKRAWNHYDFSLKNFTEFKKQKIIKNIFENEIIQNAWLNKFETQYDKTKNKTSTSVWDSQWVYTVLSQNGLCITPTKNLVANIGFDSRATHTKNTDTFMSNQPAKEIDIKSLKHPFFITPDKVDILWSMKHIFETEVPAGVLWETKKLMKNKFPGTTKLYKKTKKIFSYEK